MRVQPRRIPSGSADALALVAGMVADISGHYGPQVAASTPSATPEDFGPPGGCFVALYDDAGRALAGGGVKRLGEDVAEIKRMFVVPEARGRGLARVLLAALEDAARDLGYARVRLDTGPAQPVARALYESAGYAEIPDYNDNAYASYWGEKAL